MVMLCEKLGSLSHCRTMRFPSFGNSNFFSNFSEILVLYLGVVEELEVVAVLVVVLVAAAAELEVVGSDTQNFVLEFLAENQSTLSKRHM